MEVPAFEDVPIGATRFRVTHLAARKAVHVQVKLAGILGESLVQALATTDPKDLKDKAKVQEKLVKTCTEALGNLSSRLEVETIDFLIDSIFEKCFVMHDNPAIKPAPVHLGLFEGKPLDLWKLFIAGLKFNLAPFIEGALAATPQASAKDSDSSQSKPAET